MKGFESYQKTFLFYELKVIFFAEIQSFESFLIDFLYPFQLLPIKAFKIAIFPLNSPLHPLKPQNNRQ